VGLVIGGLGTMWWAIMVDAHPDYVRDVLPGMVLAGLGITAAFATLTGALMSRVPPRFYSMAGAARSTIFQLATAVGIAVAVALRNAGGGDPVAPFRRVWWMATVCAGVSAVVVAVALPRGRPGAEPAREAVRGEVHSP
jgi:Ca2+/H+ antiporter